MVRVERFYGCCNNFYFFYSGNRGHTALGIGHRAKSAYSTRDTMYSKGPLLKEIYVFFLSTGGAHLVGEGASRDVIGAGIIRRCSQTARDAMGASARDVVGAGINP